MGVNAYGTVNTYQYLYDLDTQTLSRKGEDGKIENLPPSEQEQILAAAGLAVKNNVLIDTITGDKFSVDDPEAFQKRLAGVGGKPSFGDTAVNNSAGPDVRAACELLENMNGSASNLMLAQLMVMLKLSQEDKKANDELLMSADSMKVLSKDDEISAKKNQIAAEKSQATNELIAACGQATTKIAAAVVRYESDKSGKKADAKNAAAGDDGSTYSKTVLQNFARYFDPMANNTTNFWSLTSNMVSYLAGANAEKQAATLAEQDAQKNSEVINQLQNGIKEARRNVKSTHDSALKLLKSVAERQTENIKAMTNV